MWWLCVFFLYDREVFAMMKRTCCRVLCVLLVVLFTAPLWGAVTGSVLSVEAAAPDKEVVPMEPKARENITLNAYLLPMTSEAQRREMYQLCKDANIDILSHLYPAHPWVAADHTAEWYKTVMREASEYGLKVLTRETRIQDALHKSDDELRAIAAEYKDIPGFGGFFVVDEPYNPNPYARVENALRSVTPEAYVSVNFLPRGVYPEGDYIRQLTDYGALLRYNGVLSLDVYCFGPNGGVDEVSLFGNYEDLRRAGLMTGMDTAVYVQSVGSPSQFGYRRPSAADLRYNMMAALAYGIKEIKFFTFGTPPEGEGEYTEGIIDRDGKPTDLYDDVCAINAYVHAIGPYIVACDVTEVYHSHQNAGVYRAVPEELFIQTDDKAEVIVSLLEERGGDAEYVMLVNKDFSAAQTFTCTVDGVPSLEIVGVDGKLTDLAMKNGQFTLTLEAGDAAVLRLPKGDFIKSETETEADLARGAQVTASSSAGENGLYLYDIYDGKYDGRGVRLSSENGAVQSVIFDLRKTETINRVDIFPVGEKQRCGAYFPAELDVSVSTDGEQWTTVATLSDVACPIKTVPVVRFSDVQARYVCLRVTDMGGLRKFCEIGDVRIYRDDGSIEDEIATLYETVEVDKGTNLALNKPVIDYSSTTDVPDWNCHHDYLTDGTDKGWASELFRNQEPEVEEWITVDLLDVYEIGKVVLTPQEVWHGVNVFPENYQIEVSVDGDAYTVVARVEGDNVPQTQDLRVLEFDAIAARYVRLKATKLTLSGTSGAGYCIEIDELEVYAAPETFEESEPETTVAESEPESNFDGETTVPADSESAGDESSAMTAEPTSEATTAGGDESAGGDPVSRGCASVAGAGILTALATLGALYLCRSATKDETKNGQ